MAVPTDAQIALVASLLPSTAEDDFEWDAIKISDTMSTNGFNVSQTVRFFWLERVNESVEYMNIGDKPLSSIHQQARAMLDYWDGVVAKNADDGFDVKARRPISFGTISRD